MHKTPNRLGQLIDNITLIPAVIVMLFFILWDKEDKDEQLSPYSD